MNTNFFPRIINLSALVFLLLLSNSCVNSSSDEDKSKTTGSDTARKPSPDSAMAGKGNTDTLAFDRKYNDISRYVAGMKANPGSDFAAMEKDSVWLKFAKNFDASWTQIDTSRLQKMAKWATTELAEERSENLDVFYPLSGPDILHANVFFPDAKNYHLYALEINGALPDLKRMTTKATETYLRNVYSSLGDIFQKSYFITHKMMNSLTASNVDGTLPLICVFLVRTGHEITNVQYFHLNDDGTEIPLKKDSIGNHHNDLVKVYFRKTGSTFIQMVSYMKCDVSDKAYADNKALQNLFTHMPQCLTYIKSASYLLHYKFFSSARDVILNKSKAILEDDTGIPYKYLADGKWSVSLYGVYVKPVSDFSGVFQEDLLKAYQDTTSGKPKKLPFSLGYHWGENKQNLIKARLKS